MPADDESGLPSYSGAPHADVDPIAAAWCEALPHAGAIPDGLCIARDIAARYVEELLAGCAAIAAFFETPAVPSDGRISGDGADSWFRGTSASSTTASTNFGPSAPRAKCLELAAKAETESLVAAAAPPSPRSPRSVVIKAPGVLDNETAPAGAGPVAAVALRRSAAAASAGTGAPAPRRANACAAAPLTALEHRAPSASLRSQPCPGVRAPALPPGPPPSGRRRPSTAVSRCSGYYSSSSRPSTSSVCPKVRRATPELIRRISRPRSAPPGSRPTVRPPQIVRTAAQAQIQIPMSARKTTPVNSKETCVTPTKTEPSGDRGRIAVVRRNMAATLSERADYLPTPEVIRVPEAAHLLGGRYKAVQGKYEELGGKRELEDSVSLWHLHGIAKDVSMSVEDVKLIHRAFDIVDRDRSGRLDIDEFQEVVYNILLQQFEDPVVARERAKSSSEWYWWGRDTGQTGTISFEEFLKWYRSNGFKEDMLLSTGEQQMRQLAKANNISANYLDRIRHAFDTYDKDKSGYVDFGEFEHILHLALKIPSHVQMPKTRVQYFWAEIDTDGSGQVCFEEFLQWWLKYFAQDRPRKHHVDEFYRSFRRIGDKHLDPPAYSAKDTGATRSVFETLMGIDAGCDSERPAV